MRESVQNPKKFLETNGKKLVEQAEENNEAEINLYEDPEYLNSISKLTQRMNQATQRHQVEEIKREYNGLTHDNHHAFQDF